MKRTFAFLAILGLLASMLSVGPASAAELDVVAPDNPKDVQNSPTGSYIVVLDEDPVAVQMGAAGVGTADARASATALEQAHDAVLRAAGVSTNNKVQDFTQALNGFSATMSHDEAVAVAAQSGVKMVVPDELRQPTTDSSGDFLKLNGRGRAHDSGLTGEGVIVGVIDTGIWPEHPSLADTGYKPAPVQLSDTAENPACDFGNTAHNENDAPFTCNNKLVGARQVMPTYRALIGADPDEFDSARDDDGHGTHTASTAAGNADVPASVAGQDLGQVTGIAPRAHVIAYKALGNQGGFTSDLAGAIDQAVADGVDVINYSVGGGPSLSGPDAIAFLFASDAGVLVATSAGNSGPDGETIGGPADIPWLTSVGASTQRRFFEGRVRLDNGQTVKGASLTSGLDSTVPLVDAEFAGGDLCLPGTLDEAIVEGKVVLCRRGAVARVDKSLAVSQAGGVGMVLYNVDDAGDLITDNHSVPSVHVDLTEGLVVKQHIAEAKEPTARIMTGFTSRFGAAPTMAQFSSRGPNPSSSDIIKPDLTAPGVQILAGASPFPDPGNVTGELFQSIAGTSMSSPHVAGVFALIHQAHPDWTPAMAKSAIMTSSDQRVKDNDRTTQATPFEMGSGHLDPGRPTGRGSAFNPGLVYDAGIVDYAAFSCGANAGIFTDETCDLLDAAGLAFDASDLNLASIGIGELAGSQTVTRTVTSVAERTQIFLARVEAPDGYTVKVSPDRIRLAPGESATFEVTITNDGSGVLDEWSYGSLTWRGGGYKVFSPIAVRGSLLDTATEVIGSGTDGSASFDVAFGYSGSYAAAGHGLEAAVITNDTVAQDPDQIFDPSDGFSNAHTFDLEGVAFFRLRLPPEATEAEADLDVYVTNPAGQIVAASTAGGTDEEVNLVLPEDGTWTVYIHGWQTIDEDSTYDLSTWAVSATPGGSLELNSAPTEATLGVVGTIEMSWSGLVAGEQYLGAVSHSDDSGLVALTLVEVAG